jgi:hypothetical protein
MSDDIIGGLAYSVTLTGPGGTQTLEAGGGGTTITLDAGTWTIHAVAYDPVNPDIVVGEGSTTITVIGGRSSSVRIPMKVDPDYEAGLLEIYIHNEAELRRIGAAVNGLAIGNDDRRFYLENDIVLTQPWTPIGSYGNEFKAKFEGQGHTITINGFTAAALLDPYIGLFGYTDTGAEIRDLKIQCNLGTAGSPLNLGGTGPSFGALAGWANHSEFDTITVSGSIGVNASAYLVCGGVVGGTSGGTTIQESSFTGTIWGKSQSGTDAMVGGIVGSPNGGPIDSIRDCYVSATVEAFGGSTTTAAYAGGIAGMNGGGVIEHCYAWANVSASNAGGTTNVAAGGIVGSQGASAIIRRCYALGTVTADGPTGDSYSGGISGYDVTGDITYCAALNTLIKSINSPDAHRVLGSGPLLSDNYAANDMTVTGTSPWTSDTGPGGKDGDDTYAFADFRGQGLGLTPGTVYDVYYLYWDFTASGDWKFIPGSGYDYPVLSWQNSPPADPASF